MPATAQPQQQRLKRLLGYFSYSSIFSIGVPTSEYIGGTLFRLMEHNDRSEPDIVMPNAGFEGAILLLARRHDTSGVRY